MVTNSMEYTDSMTQTMKTLWEKCIFYPCLNVNAALPSGSGGIFTNAYATKYGGILAPYLDVTHFVCTNVVIHSKS